MLNLRLLPRHVSWVRRVLFLFVGRRPLDIYLGKVAYLRSAGARIDRCRERTLALYNHAWRSAGFARGAGRP